MDTHSCTHKHLFLLLSSWDAALNLFAFSNQTIQNDLILGKRPPSKGLRLHQKLTRTKVQRDTHANTHT